MSDGNLSSQIKIKETIIMINNLKTNKRLKMNDVQKHIQLTTI